MLHASNRRMAVASLDGSNPAPYGLLYYLYGQNGNRFLAEYNQAVHPNRLTHMQNNSAPFRRQLDRLQ